MKQCEKKRYGGKLNWIWNEKSPVSEKTVSSCQKQSAKPDVVVVIIVWSSRGLIIPVAWTVTSIRI